MQKYIKLLVRALNTGTGMTAFFGLFLALPIVLGLAMSRCNTFQITYDVGGIPMYESVPAERFGEDAVAGVREFAELQNVSPPYRGHRPQKVAQVDYCPLIKLGLACETIWPRR
jgi:hypothetical protein